MTPRTIEFRASDGTPLKGSARLRSFSSISTAAVLTSGRR
jgi:hypothetical protein